MGLRRGLPLKLALLIGIGLVIFMLWFGMNSDEDNVPQFLNHIIPAGNCMCQTSTAFDCSDGLLALEEASKELKQYPPSGESDPTWFFRYSRDANNEGLTTSQCDVSFPGLFEDIHRASSFWKQRGGILQALDGVSLENGMVAAKISQQRLYVVSARAKGEDHRRKIVAVLSAMNRALTAVREPHTIPDIDFIFSVEDLIRDVASIHDPIWALARRANEAAAWLYPDFGYWSWNHAQADIGPYDEMVDEIASLEEVDGPMEWRLKKDQIVWRGKLSFAPKLRRALLEVARGKSWADVKEVSWNSGGNVIGMQDHCKYKFIAHVEGRSYSASLKYRQACQSVVVAHKLQFVQHHHYLLSAEGPSQNYVEVERDFSDLQPKIEKLLADPKEAQRIADNSVRTFRERYLTRAAEACYWRNLWQSWGNTLYPNNTSPLQSFGHPVKVKGERYESFILRESQDMMHFDA